MIDSILKFSKLIHKFRSVERQIFAHGAERRENDSEHSFTLAMLGWHINESCRLGYDNGKILKYSLAHDLVETYAGDTYFYTTDKAALDSKEQREKDAQERIRQEFPEFADLHESIDQYNQKSDKESKFVYALDKIEPVLNIYLDGGRTWKRNSVTLEMLTSAKESKVSIDETTARIFKELVDKLKNEHDNLFNRP